MGLHNTRHRRLYRLSFAALVCLVATSICAHEYYARTFKIIHPWALPTLIEAGKAEVYLRFEEICDDDRLISASSPFAREVNIVDQAAQKLDSIELHADQEIELRPGGTHLEMRGLTVPLQFERSYPLTLVFEKNGRIDTEISIGAH